MANEVEIIVRARDLASATLDKTAAKAEGIGAKFGPLGKVAGMAIAGIGIAAVAAAAEGVKMASTFQSTMEQLHTQAHVPQAAVDSLSQSVLGLAGKVGEGPDSLAEALYHVESSFASTGITGEKAMHLLTTASEGAKMGHADLVDVTNALDAAVVSGIPGVKNFDQAMGMLNATVGAGDMHMQDLAAAFGTGAVAVVKNYGLSLRDVGSALAVFGDNNIRGAKAGTQLRMTVQSLAVPAKGGKKALEELGLSQDTLAKDMQKGGLISAVSDLHDRLKKAGISSKQSGEVLTAAFGKKAGVGLAMLVDQFDRLKSKYKEIDKGANDFANDWKATQGTFAQQWDQVKAAVEGALIKLGLKLLPMLSKLLPGAGKIAVAAIAGLSTAIQGVADVLDPVIGFIEDHSTAFATLAVAVAAGAAAWALWTGAIAAWTLVTEIATAVQAAFDAVMDANPIMLVIIAVAALTAGIIYAYHHSETFRKIVQKAGQIAAAAFHWVLSAVSAVWGWMKSHWPLLLSIITGPIGAAVIFVVTHWHQITAAVQGAWNKIRSLGSSLWDTVKSAASSAVQWCTDQFNNLLGFVQGIPGRIKDAIGGALSWAGGLVGFAHGGIVGAVGHAATGGVRNALTLVGENGPELVNLAPGSSVRSNPDTQRAMAGSRGGSGQPLSITLQIGDTTLGELLIDPIRKSVRTRGGNVQAVLGRS